MPAWPSVSVVLTLVEASRAGMRSHRANTGPVLPAGQAAPTCIKLTRYSICALAMIQRRAQANLELHINISLSRLLSNRK